MKITKTNIEGLLLLNPKVFEDERGHFFESFNKEQLKKAGINAEFVQDNESYSKFGVLRGLHFQTKEYAQAKLVRVIKGEVLDVVVDLRDNSANFGQHASFKLSAENKHQLFIPRGFAHGFVTLSANAILQYKCDNYYHKDAEDGLVFNDSILNIDWLLDKEQFIINERDKNFQTLKQFKQKYANTK